MANTRTYLNHLLQSTGITPACSEEERAAAEEIARIFADHGFDPEMQEFTASSSSKMVHAAMGVVLFIAAILMGISGALGIVGMLLALVVGVLYVLERMGKVKLPRLGQGGLSQNVIAYHKASGPLASPRNRPVVVVAHYDSPRAELLAREPFAAYRGLINKLLPFTMAAPAVVAILRLLPLPEGLKILLWVVAILASLVPLLCAVSAIMNHFVLPYTSGAVCNKSSVAAMLGVMDDVAPSRRAVEFPNDIPFEQFMEQERSQYQVAFDEASVADAPVYEEPQAAEIPVAMGVVDEPVAAIAEDTGVVADDSEDFAQDSYNDDFEEPALPDDLFEYVPEAEADEVVESQVVEAAATEPVPVEAEDEGTVVPDSPVNAAGNLRYGAQIIRELGMLPTDCELVYETTEPEVVDVPAEPAVEPVTPVAQEPVEVVAAPVAAVVETPAVLEVPAPVEVQAEETPAPAVDEPVVDVAPAAPVAAVAPVVASVAPIASQVITPAEEELAVPAIVEELVNQRGDEFEDEVEPAPDFDDAFEGVSEQDVQPEQSIEPEYEPTLDPGSTSVVEAISDEDVLDEPIETEMYEEPQGEFDSEWTDEPAVESEIAFEEEPELILTGEEDFEEIIPTDDMEIAEAEFEILDEEPVEADQLDGTMQAPALEDVDGTVQAPALEDETIAPDATVSVDMSAILPDQDEIAELADNVESEAELPAEAEAEPVTEDAEESTAEQGAEEGSAPVDDVASTQVFDANFGDRASTGTQAWPAQPEQRDTVDSLMAQISARLSPAEPAAPRNQRQINIPNIGSSTQSSVQVPAVTPVGPAAGANRRSALFDLPDPSAAPSDPFAATGSAAYVPGETSASDSGFSVINGTGSMAAPVENQYETIRSEAPVQEAPKKKRRGLFGRKKKEESSMSDWLGVDDDFDAKRDGRDIGSWDNFDDDGWKGGAAGDATEEELREAVTSMGDDELLGHDIWFVATGSSENDNAGMKAFLDTHRDKLRGVFLINLECVGSGDLAMVSVEGSKKAFKGDKRIMGLFSRVSADFHRPVSTVELPYVDTDARIAMERSLRAMTLAGVDATGFACSHNEEDLPVNLNAENIAYAADMVTEVIRRS